MPRRFTIHSLDKAVAWWRSGHAPEVDDDEDAADEDELDDEEDFVAAASAAVEAVNVPRAACWLWRPARTVSMLANWVSRRVGLSARIWSREVMRSLKSFTRRSRDWFSRVMTPETGSTSR